jgi:acyl-CoA thioester hydrolase
MDRPPPSRRQDYRWFSAVTLRWNDVDAFGHVNNAQFYEFFDTTVVRFLHEERDLGIGTGGAMMVVAENGCRFHREVLFTDALEMGLRVERIGTSSVRYGLGAFVNGEEAASADGHFVHVFLDPASKWPAPIDAALRAHLTQISLS